MRLMTMALVLPLLAACSQTPTERQTAFGSPQATAVSAEAERGGRNAVTVIGTPFYALFKAVGCVGTVVLAAPAAAVVELTDRPDKAVMRQSLNYGVGHNCGGSWVLRG